VLWFCGLLGSVLAPACKLESSSGAGGGGGDSLNDDEAAIDALNMVDPGEAKPKVAAAEVAAVACSDLVQAQVSDPSTVDDATLAQLYAEEAPMADAEMQAWLGTVNPSTLPLTDMPYPNYQCAETPYSCKTVEYCPSGDGARCVITGCGKGKCPWCPDAWGNLIYDGYCAYACMQGLKFWGYGINLRTRFTKKWSGFFCAPFPK